MLDTKDYHIIIRKDWFDGELCFEARIAELPDVAEYADSYEEVYALALDTIEVTKQIFTEQKDSELQQFKPINDSFQYLSKRLKPLDKVLSAN